MKTPHVTILALAIALALAWPRAGGSAQTPERPPQLRIVSPAADAVVKGPALIRVALEPEGSASTVVFFVDGKQACVVSASPLECDWDAGASTAEHQIRVVANLAGGGRLVETLRTSVPHDDVAGVPIFSSHVDAVQLTVTVIDGGEHFVNGLPQSAFHVREDGAPQPISSFVATDVPLDLVVAIDISASMAPAMPKLKAAVKEFLAAVPAPNSTNLLAFNDKVMPLATPATPQAARIASIEALRAYGATSLYDVLIRGIDLMTQKTGRKAMVVFTDGEDQGSQASVDQVEQRLQSSDMTLYMIGQGRGVELENLKKIMRRLTQPTGGRALFTNKIEELKGAFGDLLGEISHQYLLAYIPTNSARDDRWRRIHVDVDGHRQVRTREGYRMPAR
jgi:Ca-activated chloride channel homolog